MKLDFRVVLVIFGVTVAVISIPVTAILVATGGFAVAALTALVT